MRCAQRKVLDSWGSMHIQLESSTSAAPYTAMSVPPLGVGCDTLAPSRAQQPSHPNDGTTQSEHATGGAILKISGRGAHRDRRRAWRSDTSLSHPRAQRPASHAGRRHAEGAQGDPCAPSGPPGAWLRPTPTKWSTLDQREACSQACGYPPHLQASTASH